MPRELTASERTRRDELAAGFDAFITEQFDVLVDFFQKIGRADPVLLLHQPDAYLPLLDAWLGQQNWQEYDEQDRIRLATRIGYFLAQVLITRYHGAWALNENPDSRFFLRYVVTHFAQPGEFVVSRDPGKPTEALVSALAEVPVIVPKNAEVDAFGAAIEYTRNPVGRTVASLLREIEADLTRTCN
jgi:hypothetical protein